MRLEILMVPKCVDSMALSNVNVIVENLCCNSAKYLRYLLSHITLSVRHEVREHQVKSMKLRLESPNATYDMTNAATTGVPGSSYVFKMAARLGVTAT